MIRGFRSQRWGGRDDVQERGIRVQASGFSVKCSRSRVLGSDCKVEGRGFRVWGAELKLYSFKIQGSRFTLLRFSFFSDHGSFRLQGFLEFRGFTFPGSPSFEKPFVPCLQIRYMF